MPETAREQARLEDVDRRLDDLDRRIRNLDRRARRAFARRDEGRPYPEERVQALLREGDECIAEARAIAREVQG